MKEFHTTGVSLVTLFFSLGTLICCVLPLIFVSLGLGAVIATLISQFPILITLSQYKIWIFLIAALLLMITGWLLWWSDRSCPVDSKLAILCNKINKWNKRIFWVAFAIWMIGFMVTYVALPLLICLEG